MFLCCNKLIVSKIMVYYATEAQEIALQLIPNKINRDILHRSTKIKKILKFQDTAIED